MEVPLQKFMHDEEEETDTGTPIRYLPLHRVYSATSPCVSASGSSNVMSKKVKARKLIETLDDPPDDHPTKPLQMPPSLIRVYTRRAKRPRHSANKPSFFAALVRRVESESRNPSKLEQNKNVGDDRLEDSTNDDDARDFDSGRDEEGECGAGLESVKVNRILKKKKKMRNYELMKLGVDMSVYGSLDGPWLREGRGHDENSSAGTRKRKFLENGRKADFQKVSSASVQTKRWIELSLEDADPSTFVGLSCKVYWPLDDDWYSGRIAGYSSETKQHLVKYEDGDQENLILSGEKIKFYVSREEMQQMNLRYNTKNTDINGLDYGEMVVLAASFDDCQELEPGDIIWAKLTGHAMWPAVVVNESHLGGRKGLKPFPGERSVPVQFFGTHDFARISIKQVISFLRGLLSSYHLKCKQTRFRRSLEEAKMYLSEQKLPKRMLRLQNGSGADDCENASGEDEGSNDSDNDNVGDGERQQILEGIKTCPLELGDLRVISLGKIVRDSDFFQNEKYIWPQGYTAERKFASTTDPSIKSFYKMEVLRDPESRFRPLFRVTTDSGEQFKGSNPSICWNKIYKRIRKMQNKLSNGFNVESKVEEIDKSGSYMFGFSNSKVFKLIRELSNSRVSAKYSGCKLASESYGDLPVGYRPVRVDWKDLDKCSVCHMDEEYENNLFLQCDKCRMMVHARCYGELEPVDGVLWLCNLCRPGAPKCPPPCCLCPVIGGAMKPTTDGRWAHLACAMWIPETCLSDIKRMEPIDGLNRINKDRWKLLCSICGVSYGACIQCSNSTCRVAYHPLCARAAGLCVELEDEDRLHLMSMDEDDDDQCIRLLSFCKRHRQPSNERSPGDEQIGPIARCCSDYIPPSNPSGCARSEPYDFFGRRGRKEPEVLAAASLKRLYVENRPYLISGYCQNGSLGNVPSSSEPVVSRLSSSFQKLKTSELETAKNILSMAEKYKHMKETFKKRLAFGKSGIHGFGIFAKQPHRAGDMVVEYTGELVRPPIADRREHLFYNSLVGAGTYMFRIDDERVIDATRAGSIAHLINHSCEPNCYSRVISVHGDEHIIIFAKRDINRWEELTYDYRFFSIDEQLACYCGFPRCRGIVNDTEAEEQMAKLCVPRNELIDWSGE
ncbi:PREDICTED: histone-lysine N-methyltransferase ATX2-like [Nelumbo nucifera]|uniref:Histone-lysine N-methyltransferase ATX2-like n=1 Tax=Nelumbo nucifera TaxID=4432 RepID=A0A1U7ZER9_NELNU|nr:PREDICTED: histone-lysine N-methyltransferase ATX2-like [Nelumbo nucifera]XP_010245954.1 PREDICTED: histone-lysine N-methyltransferase ATX2-like [Nelumbo nucifera]